MNIRLHLARAALAAALLAALLSLSFKNNAAADSIGAPTAPAATIEQPSHVTLVSRLDQTKTLRVVVGLKLRNAADLDKLIHDQSNPSSPKFRQWITPTDFLEQFAPSPSAVDTVSSYLTGQGLVVSEVTPNRLLLIVDGNVAQLERAFGVRLNEYNFQGVAGVTDGLHFFSDAEPQLPSLVAGLIDSIMGLSDTNEVHSRAVEAKLPPGVKGPRGYTPQEIASTYEFPNTINPRGEYNYTGTGRTIAVATVYSYSQKDLQEYWKQFGINRTGTLTNVPIEGGSSRNHPETTLDVETVTSQAPGADVIVYEAPRPQLGIFALVFNRIVTDNKADVVSVSWGSCEEFAGPSNIRTESAIFAQGAAQGIGFFSASGDDGAYDCPLRFLYPYYSVDYPASDPNVTAVGGTTLAAKNGKRIAEIAWSKGGGGMSKFFPRPSYQIDAAIGEVNRRHVADVAIDADSITGYPFRFEGDWVEYGGTSVGAPEWAVLWALAAEANGRRLGPANPSLYRAGRSPDYDKLFFDVTVGRNGAGYGSGYSTAPQYDEPTGWGSPHATALIEWLVGKPLTMRRTPENTPPVAQPGGDPPH